MLLCFTRVASPQNKVPYSFRVSVPAEIFYVAEGKQCLICMLCKVRTVIEILTTAANQINSRGNKALYLCILTQRE